ncbi:hypothetical protein DWX58_14200 [Pseudoflavonifractor sp. AF19-9AC]|uniref:phosphodiester glycosidase family protein n=1 Tax=Pseudoflavonifractor sp. AF19-9AC TaxID=2292244 RepID=UPI000E4A896B|nr:phosphodiester glycosidase family protein [Pseudoflavonifractor sp. AF19-9AC]RHR05681.1 hypothetical protein DWX58_14200 [Pseudoflavonifractor sp. AF19-9AC]
MKHTAAKFLRRTAAFTLAVLLALPTVYADAGEKKLQTSADLTDGLTYRNTVTVNNSKRVESFSMELSQDSEAYPILLQASGTVYGAATINKAVSYAQSLGYHVLGAINTDFFSTASGVPIGIVIEDGVYKSSAEHEDAMLITDGVVSLCEDPVVTMALYNQRTGSTVNPHHLNKWRSSTGGLYLLNEDFSTVSTRASGDGWYVRMKLVGGDDPLGIWGSGDTTLGVNSTLSLEVTELIRSDEAITIGEDEYILTAHDDSGYGYVYDSFRVGDRITLTTTCTDEALSKAQWAGGVGDIMVKDGKMTDSSSWTYTGDGRQPRTALGVKADGTLVVYAVDGRQSNYSNGLSQKDLADEMLKQGCVWAVNLDGGGSTAISVWMPGQSGPAVHNLPSDGKPRSCATYLLLVTDDKGDGTPSRLALAEDGLTVLSGTSVPLPKTVVLDSGLNILSQTADDASVTSQGLGTIENGVYTAGTRAGTDTLTLTSRSLGVEGTAQIHVVNSLTSLTVSREGSSSALTSLTVKPGEKVQLSVTGSYWGRTALRDWSGVSWTVTGDVGTVDENGLFTASQNGGSGSITATAGGVSQTIQVGFNSVHNDVPPGHWAYDAVEYCYAHGITSGISATEFGADYQIQRADFMLMLYNTVGQPAVTSGCTFTDVYPTDYYYTAISWGQSIGLAAGVGNGLYAPHEPVNREQAFTILRQFMPLVGKECPDASLSVLDVYPDKDQIADYAKGHAATLVAQGIVSGGDSGIDPKGLLSRAQMAVMLMNIMTFTPKTDVPTDPVDPPASTLTLDQSELSLTSGQSAVLKATLDPAVEGASITWSSSNPAVAAVSSQGAVTNLYAGEGTATATITASWNGQSASCTVTCAPAAQVGKVVNAEAGLNVRSGPGTDYSVIGGLTNGTQVVVLEVKDGWCHVLYANKSGQAAIGYVSGSYLEVTQRTN